MIKSKIPLFYLLFFPLITNCFSSKGTDSQLIHQQTAIFTLTSLPKTLTPTVTLLPTQTALPTPNLEDIPLSVEELLLNNANCSLPCWWGIIPGKTSWESTKQFLFPISKNIFENKSEDSQMFTSGALVSAPSPFIDEYFSNGYLIANNIVQMIHIKPQSYSKYSSIKNTLLEVGQPEYVYLGGFIDKQVQYFNLILYYPTTGLFFLYSTEVRPYQRQEIVNVCFEKIDHIDVYLWNPETWSFDETLSLIFSEYTNIFQKIENVSDIDVENFYSVFTSSDDNEGCIQTPFNLWDV